MERILPEKFVAYTKTFRIANDRDGYVMDEISRIAHEYGLSDSTIIRHALRRYVMSRNKRKSAA